VPCEKFFLILKKDKKVINELSPFPSPCPFNLSIATCVNERRYYCEPTHACRPKAARCEEQAGISRITAHQILERHFVADNALRVATQTKSAM
jgi:hypothetical protein